MKKSALKTLINQRKSVFKGNCIKATPIEAKRLNYSVKELQAIVQEAYQEIKQSLFVNRIGLHVKRMWSFAYLIFLYMLFLFVSLVYI